MQIWSLLVRWKLRLFPAAQRRLHCFQRLEIFLKPVDMGLHLRDRRAELRHRTQRAARLTGLVQNVSHAGDFLRVGVALIHRSNKKTQRKHSQHHHDHETTGQNSLRHNSLLNLCFDSLYSLCVSYIIETEMASQDSLILDFELP